MKKGEIMSRILVTGGTVFVSKRIAEYFVKKGHDVTVLNRNTKSQIEGVHLIETDRHQLSNELKGLHFDTVIDVTAYTKDDVNILLDALDDFEDYILISSSAVYPETNVQPFEETQKVGYNNYWTSYGMGKVEAETALFQRVPHAYAIRPAYLYGPYESLYREPFVFDCAMKDRPFYVPNDGSLKLQFFHVDDLCRLIEQILTAHPEYHLFNAGNEEAVRTDEWVKMCYRAAGKEAELKSLDEKIELRTVFPFRDYEYMLDVKRQKELIGDTISLDRGLKETFEWYKNHQIDVNKKSYFDEIDKMIKGEQ